MFLLVTKFLRSEFLNFWKYAKRGNQAHTQKKIK